MSRIPNLIHFIWFGKLLNQQNCEVRYKSFCAWASRFSTTHKITLWVENAERKIEQEEVFRGAGVNNVQVEDIDSYRGELGNYTHIKREISNEDYSSASDILRVNVLKTFGGFYFDLGVFPRDEKIGFIEELSVHGEYALLPIYDIEKRKMTYATLAASPNHPVFECAEAIISDMYDYPTDWGPRERVAQLSAANKHEVAIFTTGQILMLTVSNLAKQQGLGLNNEMLLHLRVRPVEFFEYCYIDKSRKSLRPTESELNLLTNIDFFPMRDAFQEYVIGSEKYSSHIDDAERLRRMLLKEKELRNSLIAEHQSEMNVAEIFLVNNGGYRAISTLVEQSPHVLSGVLEWAQRNVFLRFSLAYTLSVPQQKACYDLLKIFQYSISSENLAISDMLFDIAKQHDAVMINIKHVIQQNPQLKEALSQFRELFEADSSVPCAQIGAEVASPPAKSMQEIKEPVSSYAGARSKSDASETTALNSSTFFALPRAARGEVEVRNQKNEPFVTRKESKKSSMEIWARFGPKR